MWSKPVRILEAGAREPAATVAAEFPTHDGMWVVSFARLPCLGGATGAETPSFHTPLAANMVQRIAQYLSYLPRRVVE